MLALLFFSSNLSLSLILFPHFQNRLLCQFYSDSWETYYVSPCLPLDFISAYTLIYFIAPLFFFIHSVKLQRIVAALNHSLSFFMCVCVSVDRESVKQKFSQPVELWISSINIYRSANAWLHWIIGVLFFLSFYHFLTLIHSFTLFLHLVVVFFLVDLITGCRCAPVQLVLFFQKKKKLCCFQCCKCLRV